MLLLPPRAFRAPPMSVPSAVLRSASSCGLPASGRARSPAAAAILVAPALTDRGPSPRVPALRGRPRGTAPVPAKRESRVRGGPLNRSIVGFFALSAALALCGCPKKPAADKRLVLYAAGDSIFNKELVDEFKWDKVADRLVEVLKYMNENFVK
jgi:hypothetical protein